MLCFNHPRWWVVSIKISHTKPAKPEHKFPNPCKFPFTRLVVICMLCPSFVHTQAREACEAALVIDPAYAKARQRLASALRGLGDYFAAREELQALQFSLPHPDPSITLDLAEVEEAIQKTATAAEGSPPPEGEGSPPPEVVFERKKIVIEETNSDESDDGMGEGNAEAPPAVSAAAVAASADSAGADSAKAESPADSSVKGTEEVAASAADVDATAAAGPAFARKPKKVSAPPARPNVPAAAKTCVDFENAVKYLTPFPDQLVQYVRSLELTNYKKVFKSSMSVAVLQALLHVASLEVRKDPVYAANMLTVIPGVERFAMILPMAMKKEGVKERVRETVDAFAAVGGQLAAGAAAARKHFKL